MVCQELQNLSTWPNSLQHDVNTKPVKETLPELRRLPIPFGYVLCLTLHTSPAAWSGNSKSLFKALPNRKHCWGCSTYSTSKKQCPCRMVSPNANSNNSRTRQKTEKSQPSAAASPTTRTLHPSAVSAFCQGLQPKILQRCESIRGMQSSQPLFHFIRMVD